MVTENLKKVEKKIESACTRAGRDRNDVTLIAVSKTKPVEMMSVASLLLVKTRYRKLWKNKKN